MKKKTLLTLGVVILAVIISLYFDLQIVRGFSFIRNIILDDFFMGITFVSSEIIIFFVLTSLFFLEIRKDKRRWIAPLWLTLALSAVVSFLLKFSVQRLRPYQTGIVYTLPALEKASHLIWNYSFPSFQAMLAFSAVPILSKEFPKFKYVWIVFATLVAVSRVYFGLHFLSDVIAGGLIGYLLGEVIVKIETENRFGEKIYKKIFKKNN
jgi:undecaprenyl-diphosphatase